MLGKPRIRLNNLKSSLRCPCLGLNPIIDSVNLKLPLLSFKSRDYDAGYLSVPVRPIDLDEGRARAYCACSRCRWGSFRRLLFLSRLSLFFLFGVGWGLGTARCGLKYCLKESLAPNNQPTISRNKACPFYLNFNSGYLKTTYNSK